MTILRKVKKLFGGGTVEAAMVGPAEVELGSGRTTLVADIVGEDDCVVTGVGLHFSRYRWEETRNAQGQTVRDQRYSSIGSVKLPGFPIARGETRRVSADLEFSPDAGRMRDELQADRGGVLGALSALNLALDRTEFSYQVSVEVQVEGCIMDPSDQREVVVRD